MRRRGHAPPWLFALTKAPFGVGSGVIASAMPYLTRRAGISVADIGWYSCVFILPAALLLLYVPIVDRLLRRRTWLIALATVSALLFAVALTLPLPRCLGPFLALLFVGQALNLLCGSCNNGLVAATMPERLRGAAAGWMNTGNLGGAALGAWLTLSLADEAHVPAWLVAAALAACMILPALSALLVDEPPPRSSGPGLAALTTELAQLVRSPRGWSCLIICLSPVGSTALLNFVTALAPDYHASARLVGLVSGPLSAVAAAVGALVCGYFCDRVNRRLAYFASAAFTALVCLVTLVVPLSPATYAVGVGVYLFASGFCYASFSAMVLETITASGRSAATQYQLFATAGNVAMLYVGLIDTRFHRRWGAAGVLGADALLNLVGIVVVVAIIRLVNNAYRERQSSAVADLG
jgi:MFS family permease